MADRDQAAHNFMGRPGITCGCGMLRLLPPAVEVGHTFTLVPCPKCGMTFTGRYLGDAVEREGLDAPQGFQV